MRKMSLKKFIFPKLYSFRQVSNNAQYSSKITTVSIQSLGCCVLDDALALKSLLPLCRHRKGYAGWRKWTSLLPGEDDYLRFFNHAFGSLFLLDWLLLFKIIFSIRQLKTIKPCLKTATFKCQPYPLNSCISFN